MSNTLQTITALKESGQDFEWYPTTDNMIDMVFSSMGDPSSILDIGAGDGRVLERLDKLVKQRSEDERNLENHRGHYFNTSLDKYAIEKSMIHIENMPPDIAIVGTDFTLQALIDKKVDLVFCNPPYTEYEGWAVKVIKEANTKSIFLILPDRWKESKLIEKALKQRKSSGHVIWSGDFSDADRAARARVDIIKIVITNTANEWEREEKFDPFDVWFDEYFSDFDKIEVNESDEDEEEEEEEEPKRELVDGQNLVERLAELYTADMNNLLNNYKSLSQLDKQLLKEIGVSIDEIKKALKMKIDGLKSKYWKELFDNLDKINQRLTSSSREQILQKMRDCCTVDFSVNNAYAVVLWVIKNANQYIDDQLVEIFKELSEPECVKNYKSNLKTWDKDGWRYKKDHTNYTLDYRIVTSRHAAIKKEGCYSGSYRNDLERNCHVFIGDIFTIANNLGFGEVYRGSTYRQWESNKEQSFYAGLGENQILLARVRAFKNGNLHFKLDQKFIKTLNIEAARLLKWIKTPEEAVEQMGYSIDFVKAHFRTNLLFGSGDGRKLLTGQ